MFAHSIFRVYSIQNLFSVNIMRIFAISLVLSSFLLFQIQPLIGKYILPWFGSSPSVWSTSLLFFQSVLTGGYAYAYALARRKNLKNQAAIHAVIIVVSLIAVVVGILLWDNPLLPGESLQPSDSNAPYFRVFKVLVVSVGVPYFVLSTNSTLLQSWFSRIFPKQSPYRLYALSNAASLVGLISYPFLIEPNLGISSQAWVWTVGYFFFALMLGLVVIRFITNEEYFAFGSSEQDPEFIIDQPDKFSKVMWVVLPALASILLLATTNQITQEVAVVPFLWVLPLSLYLVSFIFCFEGDRWYGRGRFVFVLLLALGAYGLTLSEGPLVDMRIQITAYCLLFFVFAMINHGELAKLRPHPQYLTRYYLSISIGGALGGLFVSLLAPLIFQDFWELPFGLVASLFVWIVFVLMKRYGRTRKYSYIVAVVLSGLLLWVLSVSVKDMENVLSNSLWIERNFFGVIRVREIKVGDHEYPAYRLIHGITVHGMQYADEKKRGIPTTYYTETSGAGLAFRYFTERDDPLFAAILGLGTGTQAVYGREGDFFRFYEINPAVIRIAQGEGGYFSFLSDSQANIEIVQGDARLSLEHELRKNGSHQFDLLVVDTFSSDSIPAHLITREAVNLYFQHLKPNGILAVHISNIHLDLEPVIFSLADYFDLQVALAASGKTTPASSPAVWMLLGRNPEFFSHPYIRHLTVDPKDYDSGIRLWTDDYNNLFQILR
jgi:hypothetical protein